MKLKTCIYCQQTKRLTLFVKSKSSGKIDGYLNQCKDCHNTKTRKSYHDNWNQERERRRVKYVKLKDDALDNYGTTCQCCSESEKSFLTIDHMNNDGASHRKEVSGGNNFYQWLKNNNYPDGFQVLCMNCNFSKYTNDGVCIHQTKN